MALQILRSQKSLVCESRNYTSPRRIAIVACRAHARYLRQPRWLARSAGLFLFLSTIDLFESCQNLSLAKGTDCRKGSELFFARVRAFFGAQL